MIFIDGSRSVYLSLGIRIHTLQDLFAKMKKYSETINVLTAATDVFIATTMVVLLVKGRTGFSRTNRLINRLIVCSRYS